MTTCGDQVNPPAQSQTQIRVFPFSALFAPTALTKGRVLLFLQAKPAKTAKLYRKWPAKQARMQGKGRMGKP